MQLGLETIAPSIAGLEAVLVTVIPDNLLYDAWSKGQRVTDPEESATYFGDLVRIHFDALESVRVERGDIQITIETDGLIILLRNIGANYVISLVFQEQLPLGLMRLHTQRLIQFVEDNLPTFDDEDSPEVPSEVAPDAEPDAESEPAREYHGYVYARDAGKREAGAFELPPDDSAAGDSAAGDSAQEERAKGDSQSDEERQAEQDEEARQYHGYVYARDKERRAAKENEASSAPTSQDQGDDILGANEGSDADAFLLDVSADATFPSPDTNDGAFELSPGGIKKDHTELEETQTMTAPKQVDKKNNESEPARQREKDHEPDTTLHTEEQVEEMVDEGGPVLPSDDPDTPTEKPRSEDAAPLTTPKQVAGLMNEGGPTLQNEKDHEPARTLHTEEQVDEMVDEGGPVLEPAIQHPPGAVLRTKEQVEHMIDEGSPVKARSNSADRRADDHPPGEVRRTREQVAQMMDEGGPAGEPSDYADVVARAHPPGEVLRTKEQVADMMDEGGSVEPTHERKHAYQPTMPVDILAENPEENPPVTVIRHVHVHASTSHMDATLDLHAVQRMEFEGGISKAEPADTPAQPVAEPISLAEQELQMTDEGGPAMPISTTAKDEALEAKLAAARIKTREALRRGENGDENREARAPQNPNERRYPSMAREARESGITAITRAELIIAFVTENTSAPQNVHARLAVHSRVPLDAIKAPDSLDAEQVLRLEEAAKSILGVSELKI